MTSSKGDNSFVSPVTLMKGECLKHHLFKTLLAQLILVYSSTQAAPVSLETYPLYSFIIIKSQLEVNKQQQQQQKKPP